MDADAAGLGSHLEKHWNKKSTGEGMGEGAAMESWVKLRLELSCVLC